MIKHPLLSIQNLTVSIQKKTILQNINLTIYPGEIHALLGNNGAGKSTLGHVLVGSPGYDMQGNILFAQQPLQEMSPEARAQAGLFMAFQQPVEIPGVSNMQFLQTIIQKQHKTKKQTEMKSTTCLQHIKKALETTGWDKTFLGRSVNSNFSGGEKKRSELLQLLLLQPTLAILDETDSGLDSTGRQLLIQLIQEQQKKGSAFIIITHYHNLLEHLQPTKVHTLTKGILTI